MSQEPSPRFDVIMVPTQRTQRVAEGLVRSLVRYLAGRRIAVPREEALAKTWCELYLTPEGSAHEPFVLYGYTGETPIFHEMALYWADAPVGLEYAGLDGASFYLEFRGCLFQEPLGHFRTKFGEVTNIRAQIFQRPHAVLPPHREVPPGEEYVGAKKRDRGPGAGVAGTSVEEW